MYIYLYSVQSKTARPPLTHGRPVRVNLNCSAPCASMLFKNFGLVVTSAGSAKLTKA